MNRRSIPAAMLPLLATGCVGVFFGPGYSCHDTRYFAAPPIVLKTNGHYALQWRYGSMGFFYVPSYAVRNDALFFSLQATSSSGSLAAQPDQILIEGTRPVRALESGGAYWWSTDGTVTPSEVIE